MTTGETWRTWRHMLVIGGGCALALVALLGPVAWNLTHDQPSNPVTGYNDPRLERQAGESDIDYTQRAWAVINTNTRHCSDRWTAPQTWEVAALRTLPVGFDEWELIAPAGLRCGFCSQRALLLAAVLRRNGIEADAYGLDGHVVTRVTTEGRTYLTDPDLGVALVPFDRGPEPLKAAYSQPLDYELAGIADIVADTSTDQGAYPRNVYEAVAAKQARMVEAIQLGRWFLVAAGTAVAVTSLRGASRSARSTNPPTDSRHGIRSSGTSPA